MAKAARETQSRCLVLLSIVAASLAVGVSAWGCGGTEDGVTAQSTVIASEASDTADAEPKRGGAVRVAVVEDHTTFDPPVVLALPDIIFSQQVYDKLVFRDPETLALQPMLAESWAANDSLTRFTFNLRQGVSFHHGKQLKAEDVVHTFDRLLDPDVGSPIATTLDFVTDVLAPDERTVVFNLAGPNAYLPSLVSLYHAAVTPADVDTERLVKGEFGTGPFMLDEYVVGEHLVMERNPDYWWEEYPYLDRGVFFYIPDPEIRAAALRTGVVDVIYDLVASNVATIESNPETRVSEAASAGYMNLAMDTRVAPFDNVKVRRALQAATDREAIRQAALFGRGEIAYDHPIPAGDPHFWEGSEASVLPYNVDLARELLKQAGYPDGLDLTLYTSTSGGTMVEMALAFKKMAEPAGIRIKIQREPEERYWADVWMVKPFTTAWWGGRPPDEALSIAYKSDGKWNESFYNNPRVDELIVKARSQMDFTKRRQSYEEIQRILINEVPRIIPVFRPIFSGLRLNVRDCEANQKLEILLFRCWLDD